MNQGFFARAVFKMLGRSKYFMEKLSAIIQIS